MKEQTSPHRFAALAILLMVMGSIAIPGAHADDDACDELGLGPQETVMSRFVLQDCIDSIGNPDINPDVSVEPWQLSGECSGQFATTTQTSSSGWFFALGPFAAWKSDKKATVLIDFTFTCDVVLSTTVTGWGSLLRRVGIEYGITTQTYDPLLGTQTFASQTEDETVCRYAVGSCTVTYDDERPGVQEYQARVSGLPGKECFTPTVLTAFNRADYPDAGYTAVTKRPSSPGDICAAITWTEVDNIEPPTPPVQITLG